MDLTVDTPPTASAEVAVTPFPPIQPPPDYGPPPDSFRPPFSGFHPPRSEFYPPSHQVHPGIPLLLGNDPLNMRQEIPLLGPQPIVPHGPNMVCISRLIDIINKN